MKIVNLKTFRELPENTLFSKFEPSVFGELEIKGETWKVDFLSTGPLSSCIKDFRKTVDDAFETGRNLTVDFYDEGRDGLFEDKQLFAIWDNQDIAKLITRLQECIK